MRSLGTNMLVLGAIGMGIAVSAPALAVNAVGPYYATPSWDQTLPAATRFIVLTNMNSEAVLDRETGLVWEQSPTRTTLFTHQGATSHCAQVNVGGRKGWRLPTVQDLGSLVDMTQSNPTLPSGHPFTVLPDTYWSATLRIIAPATQMWVVNFGNGTIFDRLEGTGARAWCVRGGQSEQPQ